MGRQPARLQKPWFSELFNFNNDFFPRLIQIMQNEKHFIREKPMPHEQSRQNFKSLTESQKVSSANSPHKVVTQRQV